MPQKPKISSLQHRIKKIDTQTGSSFTVLRIRGWKLQKIRERILLRDEYTCRHCGRVAADLKVDHIVPLFLGGAESDDNRQGLCEACHNAKSALEQQGRGGQISIDPEPP